ncbi:MAG: alkaline phosphatase family protein [Treponema sp.]|nr:alkaline phosphatase family protein [Treponema sp.]
MKPKNYPALCFLGLDGAVGPYIFDRVKKGELPNFARAFREGCYFPDCRPPYPSITPTCWASLATGTTADRHGLVCQEIHPAGTSIDTATNAYHAGNLRSEPFWEAAARAGKTSLIINYPIAGPADTWKTGKALVAMSPGFVINGSQVRGSSVFTTGIEIPQQFFTYNAESEKSLRENDSVSSASGYTWQPSNPAFANQAEKADGYFILKNHFNKTNNNACGVQPVTWYFKITQEGGVLYFSIRDMESGKGLSVPAEGWSETFTRTLKNNDGSFDYVFKARLMYHDPSSGSFVLYFPPSGDPRRLAWPPEFAEDLLYTDVLPGGGVSSEFINPAADPAVMVELQKLFFDRHKRIIGDALVKGGIDIVVTYEGFLDSVNHVFKSALEGVNVRNPGEAAVAEAFYRQAYECADEYVGWLYDNVIGPETTLLIVSDHGAVGFDRAINPFVVLEKAGLLHYKTNSEGHKTIDAGKTIAWPFGTSSVYVNLKGREPNGIVEPADYEKTVHRIIAALQDGFRDPETGLCALAFAVPNEQAGFAGLGGDRAGDVVYGIMGSRIGGAIGGVHACQIPTARTKTGDIRALCLIAGPGFKKNEIIRRPINNYDIIPTLFDRLGYPQPADATGAIAFQAFK